MMKSWNRKCRQMRQLTISHPLFWGFQTKHWIVPSYIFLLLILFFLFPGVGLLLRYPEDRLKVVNMSFHMFCGPMSWWNLNWKCWNYRQIVQWWYLVFWTLWHHVSIQQEADSRLTSFSHADVRRRPEDVARPCLAAVGGSRLNPLEKSCSGTGALIKTSWHQKAANCCI